MHSKPLQSLPGATIKELVIMSIYETMKKYEVAVESVEDFCNRYHRRDAFQDRGTEYMKCDIESHKKELEECGYTLIPRGTSITGDNVTYYGRKEL